MMSPACSSRIMRQNSLRPLRLAPLAFSSNMSLGSTPAAIRAARCILASWSDVETRAYPHFFGWLAPGEGVGTLGFGFRGTDCRTCELSLDGRIRIWQTPSCQEKPEPRRRTMAHYSVVKEEGHDIWQVMISVDG